MDDWEALRAQIRRQNEPEELEWDLGAHTTPEVEPGVQNRGTSNAPLTPEKGFQHQADWKEQDRDRPSPATAQETLKTRIQREAESIAKRGRFVGQLTPTLFGVVGVLLASQVYTWVRLERRPGLDQGDAGVPTQESLQTDVKKLQADLDQARHQVATLNQAYHDLYASRQKAILPKPEAKDRQSTATKHEQPKLALASAKSAATPHSLQGAVTGSTLGVSTRLAAAPGPLLRDAPATHQEIVATRLELTATRQELSATRQDLSTTRRELSTTREDLHATQKELRDKTTGGEQNLDEKRKLSGRDYVEFTLLRSNSRHEVVPGISLQLKKIDVKSSRCRLNIYADDYELPDTQIAGESVTFPIRAGWQSVELMVEEVRQDGVVGHLSAPKGVLMAAK